MARGTRSTICDMKRRSFLPVQTIWKWLPPVVVVTIAGLAVFFAIHINNFYFKTGRVEAPSKLSADQYQQCVQKATQNGAISTEDLVNCTEKQMPTHLTADVVKTNIDELKWLLTVILSIAALFTVLQAAAAWFSATSYDKQANEKLKQIDEVQQSVRARYPLFEEVERARERAHADLIAVLKQASKADDPNAGPTEALSWLDNFYRDWDLIKRQRLLSVESFVSFDIDPGRSKDVPEDLKRFAVFYHAKYRYEKVLRVASFQDLERAETYLRLAIEKAHFDFTIWNELGNLYLTMKENLENLEPLPPNYPNYLIKARDAFKESVQLEEKQQRANYNLAVIANNYDKDYAAACDLLDRALQQKTWQKNSSSDFLTAYICYNMGCNRARLCSERRQGPTTISMAEGRPCVESLKRAASLGAIAEKTVTIDFTDPVHGDLCALYANADSALKAELEKVRAELISPVARKTTAPSTSKTVREALSEAVHLVWNSVRKSA